MLSLMSMIKYILLLLLPLSALAITAKEARQISDKVTNEENAKLKKEHKVCWQKFENSIDSQIETAAKAGWYFTFVKYDCEHFLILGPDSLKSFKDKGFRIDSSDDGIYVYWRN